MKWNFQKSGTTGIVLTILGCILLAVVFAAAFNLYQNYFNVAQSNNNASTSSSFIGSLNSLLYAAIVVMFLGIMGWVGSIFLTRGVDFMKVDKGVGVVTFKVDKGVGIVSGIEVTGRKDKIKDLDLDQNT